MVLAAHSRSAAAGGFMTAQIVVAVFDSFGIAKDARNRLHTEGVPDDDISVRVLDETAPMPPSAGPEHEALSVDPLIWGNVKETFARIVHNGETAVMVRALSDEEIEFAAMTLRQYEPVAIEVMAFHSTALVC